MKLTANFDAREFACKDGSPVPAELLPNVQALAEQLQVIRDAIGEPLHIVSGYRTERYNAACGGASNSYHLRAMAADLSCKSRSPKQLHGLILALIKDGKLRDGGVGKYSGFVHYDIGPSRRW